MHFLRGEKWRVLQAVHSLGHHIYKDIWNVKMRDWESDAVAFVL